MRADMPRRPCRDLKLRALQALISAPVTHKAPLSSLELECPREMAVCQPFRV